MVSGTCPALPFSVALFLTRENTTRIVRNSTNKSPAAGVGMTWCDLNPRAIPSEPSSASVDSAQPPEGTVPRGRHHTLGRFWAESTDAENGSLRIFLPIVLLSCAQRNLHSPRFRDHKKPLQVSCCLHSIQYPWKLTLPQVTYPQETYQSIQNYSYLPYTCECESSQVATSRIIIFI